MLTMLWRVRGIYVYTIQYVKVLNRIVTDLYLWCTNQFHAWVCIMHPVQQLDPNSEVLHWLEVTQLKNTLYAQPFVVPSSLLPS